MDDIWEWESFREREREREDDKKKIVNIDGHYLVDFFIFLDTSGLKL